VIRKKYMIPLILAFCLVTALFITVSAQPPGEPEPVEPETPNPFSTETDMILLRGTKANSGDDMAHYLLIDEDTPYPSQNVPVGTRNWYQFEYKRWDYETVTTKVTLITQIYDETFIYDRLPSEGYIISGMPSVSLAFNVTSGSSNPTFRLFFYADLYKYSIHDPGHSWKEIIDFGDYERTYNPHTVFPVSDLQTNIWFGIRVDEPIYVASHEKLALKVSVVGSCAYLGGADVSLDFLHAMNTDELLLNIPIQYE
jgi:hypothetical protein